MVEVVVGRGIPQEVEAEMRNMSRAGGATNRRRLQEDGVSGFPGAAAASPLQAEPGAWFNVSVHAVFSTHPCGALSYHQGQQCTDLKELVNSQHITLLFHWFNRLNTGLRVCFLQPVSSKVKELTQLHMRSRSDLVCVHAGLCVCVFYRAAEISFF